MIVDEVRLEKLRIGLGVALSQELMDVKTSFDVDIATGRMLVAVHGYVWTEKLIEVFYPRDWWEAFKGRWFPGWYKRRFPIKYVHIEGRALYPKLKHLSESDERYQYVRQFKQEEL